MDLIARLFPRAREKLPLKGNQASLGRTHQIAHARGASMQRFNGISGRFGARGTTAVHRQKRGRRRPHPAECRCLRLSAFIARLDRRGTRCEESARWHALFHAQDSTRPVRAGRDAPTGKDLGAAQFGEPARSAARGRRCVRRVLAQRPSGLERRAVSCVVDADAPPHNPSSSSGSKGVRLHLGGVAGDARHRRPTVVDRDTPLFEPAAVSSQAVTRSDHRRHRVGRGHGT